MCAEGCGVSSLHSPGCLWTPFKKTDWFYFSLLHFQTSTYWIQVSKPVQQAPLPSDNLLSPFVETGSPVLPAGLGSSWSSRLPLPTTTPVGTQRFTPSTYFVSAETMRGNSTYRTALRKATLATQMILRLSYWKQLFCLLNYDLLHLTVCHQYLRQCFPKSDIQ